MMDAVTDPTVRRISAMMGAQTGKTECLINNTIGYYIAHNPQSIMVMQPTLRDMQTWMEAKLNPMLDETDVVKERIAKPRGRDGVNNQQMKSFPGGYLMFSYSGSPNTMRGRSAPIILCDEIDGYEVTGEGDPVNLLWQRAATFSDRRKLIETSTPTIKGVSRIERAFQSGDMRRFWLPCPHCGEWQTLKWSQVVWDKDDTGDHDPISARYVCEHNECVITDGDKVRMMRKGEWRAEKKFKGHASFHLSELYSPFRKWRDIVESFLEKKRANDLQSFVNVSLAETWEEQGESVDQDGLMERREDYTLVPADVLLLTAGVDVQQDRIEVETVGWGADFESWGIDRTQLWGDPNGPELWEDLDRYLLQQYETEDGHQLGIACTCIDSGYLTSTVYQWVAPKLGRRIYAVKGVAGEGRPIVQRSPKPRTPGKTPKTMFAVGVDGVKGLILAGLTRKKPGPGYAHFPEHYPSDFFEQLTAEKRVTKYRKGFAYREWIKIRHRNEALDIRVYAYAAVTILNPIWNALKRAKMPEDDAKVPENAQTAVQKQLKKQRIQRRGRGKSRYMDGWR